LLQLTGKPGQAGPVKYRARSAMTPSALAGVGVTSPPPVPIRVASGELDNVLR
jgi:hypothetical protein